MVATRNTYTVISEKIHPWINLQINLLSAMLLLGKIMEFLRHKSTTLKKMRFSGFIDNLTHDNLHFIV